MISALSWIPKGAAAQHPKKLDLSQEEYDAISKEIGSEVLDARLAFERATLEDNDDDTLNEDGEEMQEVEVEGEKEGIEKYDLDTYDEDTSTGKAGIYF
jgi:periodic tryptophan protein 1